MYSFFFLLVALSSGVCIYALPTIIIHTHTLQIESHFIQHLLYYKTICIQI